MKENLITKSKLARKYGWSLVLLRKKIHTNRELWKELKENSYTVYQKVLTPLQLEIIYRYLGRPEG
jgi:hypothetical protein